MKTTYDAVNEFRGEWYGSEDKVYICDTGVITGYEQFNDLVSQMETNFGKCEKSYSDYKFDYHLSPEPILTYTQAMADNGELPSVGMECLILNTNCAHPKYIKGLIKYVGDLVVYAYVENGERCDNAKTLKFKPLTPPIELIDGKAYQFDYRGGSLQGVYDDNGKVMWNKGSPRHLDNCTNIQPLTVDVK